MKLRINKKLNLKQKSLLLLAFVVFLVPAKLVFAQDNTSDSSSSAAQNKEDENSILDGVKKAIEKKTELGTAGANLRSERAYLAQVLRVSKETLTVNNYSGSKIIPLEEDVIIQEKNKDIAIDEIAVDDWVGIYGEMIGDNNLKIKKVTVYENDFTPQNKIITLGSISSIGKNDLSLAPRSGEKELHFSFGKNTNFQDNQGEEIDASEFYEDLQCLVVAFEDKNGNYVISTVKALSAFEK